MEEQHSGFSYKCPFCGKMLARPMSHVNCSGRPKDLMLFHRETGTKGSEALLLLQTYKDKKMPQQWEERLKTPLLPTPVSPLPRTPIRLATPLEKCYGGKRRAPPSSWSNPSKRSRYTEETGTAEDPDWGHDPVPISLDQPDEIFNVEPDPSLKNVYFSSPTRLSDSSDDESDNSISHLKPLKSLVIRVTPSGDTDLKNTNPQLEINRCELINMCVNKDSTHSEIKENKQSNHKKDVHKRKQKSDSEKKSKKKEQSNGTNKSNSDKCTNNNEVVRNSDKESESDRKRQDKSKINEKDSDSSTKSERKEKDKDDQTSVEMKGDISVEKKSKDKQKKETKPKKDNSKDHTKTDKHSCSEKKDRCKGDIEMKTVKESEHNNTTNYTKSSEKVNEHTVLTETVLVECNGEDVVTCRGAAGGLDDNRTGSTEVRVPADQMSTEDRPVGSVGDDTVMEDSAIHGFPYTEIPECASAYGEVEEEDNFDLGDLNLDVESYHSFTRLMVKSKHKDATPYIPIKTEQVTNKKIVQKVLVETFKKLQQVQEERVILNIGGQVFQTSAVTLRADPTSLFGVMLREGCPLRPSRNTYSTYFFDRDPAHFRFILNYLRNGALLDAATLPHERRYLMELLTEARFYQLSGLQEIILARLRQVTRSNDKY